MSGGARRVTLPPRKLRAQLKERGCVLLRDNGSHQIWKTQAGTKITVLSQKPVHKNAVRDIDRTLMEAGLAPIDWTGGKAPLTFKMRISEQPRTYVEILVAKLRAAAEKGII